MRTINNPIQILRQAKMQIHPTHVPALRAPCIMALALFLNHIASAGTHDHHSESPKPSGVTQIKRPSGAAGFVEKLPPLPSGVAEVNFNEFFLSPVGPRGLELTEKLRGLDGRRVRIPGYMAHRDVQPPGVFLLTPFPVQIHDHDNGLAEDFPASVVHVSVPTVKDQPVPFAPGLMLLTGTLHVGGREEPDGRISLVRLDLDPPAKFAKQKSRVSPAKGAKGAALLMR